MWSAVSLRLHNEDANDFERRRSVLHEDVSGVVDLLESEDIVVAPRLPARRMPDAAPVRRALPHMFPNGWSAIMSLPERYLSDRDRTCTRTHAGTHARIHTRTRTTGGCPTAAPDGTATDPDSAECAVERHTGP